MRVLVISDIHGNLEALEAVLQAAEAEGGFERIWCLGDVVGYGPNPNECVARLREFDHICVLGNHDAAALGRVNLEDFNPDARQAVLWTQKQLTPVTRSYLESRPERVVIGDYTIVHGSPRDPVWEYIISPSIAQEQFHYFDTDICLVGHTHVPAVYHHFSDDRGRWQLAWHLPEPGETYELRSPDRWIVNPGSVGQPRDQDPRAAYALLDVEERRWHYYRVPYNIERTQYLMRKAGLPPRLIARLSYGW
ncbi:MAG: metallophosphoesterase family protein [Chloroflexi bacterium]|nr:metallophosphoesterase family protein [Chloroflexota bacterium]